MDYSTLITFTNALSKAKDPHNHHGIQVIEMSRKIGLAMNLDANQMQLLEIASGLHDVGKVLLDDELLNHNRKLTVKSRAAMETHATMGYKLLTEIGCDKEICEAVLYHHEHYDGSGYPKGLKGDNIPLLSRIICISDMWEALTHDRAYRKAMSSSIALGVMNEFNHWFDPVIYTAFLKVIR